VAAGPWDPVRAGTPGRGRFLASDADRERAIDVLKTAFVQGTLTRDDLGVRTGRALAARTYAELAAITGGLTVRPALPTTKTVPAPARRRARRPDRRRVSKKVVAWSACAVVLAIALGATFLSDYGGFLVMMLFTFIGAVLLSKPPAPSRPGPPPLSGRR
jgi:hypothetical protein